MQQQQQQTRLPERVETWREWFPKEYLSAEDFRFKDGSPGYRAFTLKIARVEIRDVQQSPSQGGGKKQKPVLFFWKNNKDLTKGLVLNVTMCKEIEGILGSPNPRDWMGKAVEMYVQTGVKCPKSDEHPDGKADVIRLRKAKERHPVNQDTSPLAEVQDDEKIDVQETLIGDTLPEPAQNFPDKTDDDIPW